MLQTIFINGQICANREEAKFLNFSFLDCLTYDGKIMFVGSDIYRFYEQYKKHSSPKPRLRLRQYIDYNYEFILLLTEAEFVEGLQSAQSDNNE